MIIFDTETTGLIDNIAAPLRLQPHIIELFALKIDDETIEEVATFSSLFNPGEKLQDKIIQVTGITDDMLADAPKFASAYFELTEFFLGERIVAGHNVNYDVSMLVLELRRIDREHMFPFPPHHICTVEATEHLKGRRLKLQQLYEHLFGEKFEMAHSAEADVRATARCVLELMCAGAL